MREEEGFRAVCRPAPAKAHHFAAKAIAAGRIDLRAAVGHGLTGSGELAVGSGPILRCEAVVGDRLVVWIKCIIGRKAVIGCGLLRLGKVIVDGIGLFAGIQTVIGLVCQVGLGGQVVDGDGNGVAVLIQLDRQHIAHRNVHRSGGAGYSAASVCR